MKGFKNTYSRRIITKAEETLTSLAKFNPNMILVLNYCIS